MKGVQSNEEQTIICEISVHSRLRPIVHTWPCWKWRCGVRDGEQSPVTISQEYLPAQPYPYRSVAGTDCRSSYSLVCAHEELAVWLSNVSYHALVKFLLSFCDQFVIPMSIITYCYFRILRKVSQDMIIQNVQFSASLSQKQRVDAISRKKKVNYILIGMVATFICCWLPLTAVNLVKDY
ncbi:hypothetical protein COOONC_10434, partial [Cooperia oncophora]